MKFNWQGNMVSRVICLVSRFLLLDNSGLYLGLFRGNILLDLYYYTCSEGAIWILGVLMICVNGWPA